MSAPELDVGNAFYYVAFNDLASCRLFENGMIPWTAIKEYADECQIADIDERGMLFEVMRSVDVWYMDKKAAKIKREAGKAKR
jgi:hypothetical protein